MLASLRVAAISLLLVSAAAVAQDDHPLLTRYTGSEIASHKAEAFAQCKLVTAVTDKAEFTAEEVEGRLTRIVYNNPAERSTLEIFSNYQQALATVGARSLFTCALDDCGPSWARSSWNRFNGLFAAADGDPRYLATKLQTSDGTAYIAVMVGKRRTQVDIVEVVGMQGDMVVADAAALAKGIAAEGRVSVYGIHFDTDKADIKPESQPALDEIAKLLREQSELKLYVVGHTDMQGALAHNRSLSESRARAVVKVLVEKHGIAAARLEGHGVGPLAPVASNANDGGRGKNRRVELVAR
ncbi:MAG TPA: DUF4892 domain-containing protein [Arenimonas sp.]|nr:DUF4892 domain-containing protein [Arenimonas sp.]